ncbi:MAG: hypothetical protein E7773_04745 [Sphingomonas sp.]|uniref:hypothetical protein n=1 Tax=Sphingomonas sp. TaxID=28214 RepID=UPI0011F6218B|nr:hypothetical protein [Sphingomonas sp.]THD37336.1 MAG: hypothetical protein E7773_04745 [Sphingomonas sp.]
MNLLATFLEQHVAIAVAVIMFVLLTMLLSSRATRFWLMDRWMDLWIIGTLPRKARMKTPDFTLANRRLDQVYRAYRNFIGDLISEPEFKNKRSFLRLAGDADAKPTPVAWSIGIFCLLGAEALAFSFVLATVLSPDPTESQANALTLVIAFLLAFLLAYMVGKAGHSFRRTHALRQNIAKLRARPGVDQGEKPETSLISLIDPEEDQERDAALTYDNSPQRLLNRVRKNSSDRGSYILPIFAALLVVALAFGQVWLREYSFEQAAAAAPAPIAAAASTATLDGDTPAVVPAPAAQPNAGPLASGAALMKNQQIAGNIVLVLIFVTTQALAFSIGYRFDFIGRGGVEVYRALRGAAIYSELSLAQSSLVHMADESLKSLVERFNERYPDMVVDDLTYRQRCARDVESAGNDGTPPPAQG